MVYLACISDNGKDLNAIGVTNPLPSISGTSPEDLVGSLKAILSQDSH
jgi:hypothetical protein